jgi:hypothetical protein
MEEEQRSKWRESSAVGVAVALMMFVLLGAAILLVLGGWPVFEAQVAPPATKPNGSVAE